MECPGRPGALKGCVVVRVPLGGEGEIRPLQELRVFVPMEIEAGCDGHIWTHYFTEPTSDLSLGSGHIPHCHGTVQGEINPIHRQGGPEVLDHEIKEVVEGLLGVPAP